MQDGKTLLLNSLLLFVVLFYVYPLKFVSTAFIDGVLFHQATVEVRLEQVPIWVGSALLLPLPLAGFSGFGYVLIGVVETWHGATQGRLRRELAPGEATSSP